ncbi:MBL fold metallo-hydrolase [Nonlabens antarcticus]|uniref:MBL fold metallo-hydrolase n=1 Tax=Nonlabens antarcticus TaxID=392714 RepID=UPI00189197EF|nr:MBL fold metallo-hydrolase [Nonlabens antarcticus]
MKNLLWLPLVFVLLFSCKENESQMAQTDASMDETMDTAADENVAAPDIQITPISHATFVMDWDGQIIIIDPVGGNVAMESMPKAEIILVTDIHGDHFNKETIASIKNDTNFLFAPQAVADQLDADLKPTVILNNGEEATRNGLKITAIPMYNITEGRLDKHPKGRGNGYVLEKDGYRVYISGDTEGIPEMRKLEDIDKAFVCMNLPYTMDVEQASDAVLAFAPKEVIPYHYRGTNGLSDVDQFKTLVNDKNPDIKVTLMEWYPNMDK